MNHYGNALNTNKKLTHARKRTQDPDCATVPTLMIDTVIDCFFLIDIIINFNTGLVWCV
jgi:hypothetical protein